MGNKKQKIIILGGPTCSGKTDVSVALSQIYPFEIVNYDSLCFYKYFDIGSAKPEKSEILKVKHHLIDIKFPDENYNAFNFSQDASSVIAKIEADGKLPLFAGGTGLYIKSLLYGLSPIPAISGDEIRKKLSASVEEEGLINLYKKLLEVDEEYALRISSNDKSRIIRALEVFYHTGKPLSYFINLNPFKEPAYDFLNIIFIPPKIVLKKRIEERTKNIIRNGLADETYKIINMGYKMDLKPFNSIGYKQSAMYLSGIIKSESELYSEIVKATTQYAKRQITWFRKSKNAIFIEAINEDERLNIIKENIDKFLI
ncbi:MAG: tRNA (adenosine(37)-N6)-dimethylallyltransferase MiaA [bacterium]